MNDISAAAVIRSWFADGRDYQVAHGNEADAIVNGVESGGKGSSHKSRHSLNNFDPKFQFEFPLRFGHFNHFELSNYSLNRTSRNSWRVAAEKLAATDAVPQLVPFRLFHIG
jgi:hypothetical protein